MRNLWLIVAAIVLLWPTAVKAQGCYSGSSSCYSGAYSSTQVYSSVQMSAPPVVTMQASPVLMQAVPMFAAPAPMFAAPTPMRGKFKQIFKSRGGGLFSGMRAGGCY